MTRDRFEEEITLVSEEIKQLIQNVQEKKRIFKNELASETLLKVKYIVNGGIFDVSLKFLF